MEFMLNTSVIGGKIGTSGAKITVEDNKTKAKKELDAENVLVATGRKPFTEGLGCEAAGLKLDKIGRI